MPASTFSYVHNTVQTQIHFRHFGLDEIPIHVETEAKKSREGRLGFGKAAMEELGKITKSKDVSLETKA